MDIYESSTVIIKHYKKQQYLHTKWRDFTPRKEFSEIINFIIEYISKNNIHLVLSDITKQRIVAPPEQEYTANKVIQFYNTYGECKNAFIIIPKSIAAHCATGYMKLVHNNIHQKIIQMFESETEALNWLLDSDNKTGNSRPGRH